MSVSPVLLLRKVHVVGEHFHAVLSFRTNILPLILLRKRQKSVLVIVGGVEKTGVRNQRNHTQNNCLHRDIYILLRLCFRDASFDERRVFLGDGDAMRPTWANSERVEAGSVSSVGRASCLCRDGRGFDPPMEHLFSTNNARRISFSTRLHQLVPSILHGEYSDYCACEK